MAKSSKRFALALLAALPVAVSAAGEAAQTVVVKDAWVRATVPGQRATGAFMELTAGDDAALVSASSPIAALVEVHEMVLDGTVMKMRAVPRLELPAGSRVELRPGGYHLMLMELRRPLQAGDTVPLSLRIERRGGATDVEVQAEVRGLGYAPTPMRH